MKHLTWLIGLAIFSASCHYERREYGAKESIIASRVTARPDHPEAVSTARPAGALAELALCIDNTPAGWMSCGDWANVRDVVTDSACSDFDRYCSDPGTCQNGASPVARKALQSMSHCVETPMLACDQTAPIDCCNDDGSDVETGCMADSDCAHIIMESPCRVVTCSKWAASVPGVCVIQTLPAETECPGGHCAFDGFCE